jgi:hypothetical protein
MVLWLSDEDDEFSKNQEVKSRFTSNSLIKSLNRPRPVVVGGWGLCKITEVVNFIVQCRADNEDESIYESAFTFYF